MERTNNKKNSKGDRQTENRKKHNKQQKNICLSKYFGTFTYLQWKYTDK